MTTKNPEPGTRKVAVLRAVVEEFVRTGEPVGSETIADRASLGVSSATIRNEMAALEELGFLMHPHTSAGRVPTDLGYRLYVNTLSVKGRLRDTQRKAIAQFFEQTVIDLEEVLQGTTQLLSRVTQYAGVAVPPTQPEDRIVRTDVVDIGSRLLLVVIGHGGTVYKRALDKPDGLAGEALTEACRRLEGEFRNLSLKRANARATQLAKVAPEGEERLLRNVARAFGELEGQSGGDHVLVGGVANLAGELATWRRETMRKLFEALERESDVLRLLRAAAPSDEDLWVTIGEEHPSTGAWEASVVAAPFRAGEEALGTIGVLGPTRMDYVSTMAAVRAVARRLSELATELERGRQG